MIKCSECPRCEDPYPGKTDEDGYHFHICGMSGNIVYAAPHKMKRYSGHGYIHLGEGSCWIYETEEDVLRHMTRSEIERWKKRKEGAKTA